MRWAARSDRNQAEIVDALRAAGAVVTVLSRVGQGVADLAVGKHGRFLWMEVKTEKGELTDVERAFMEKWRGHYVIVRSVDDALRAIEDDDVPEYHGEGVA